MSEYQMMMYNTALLVLVVVNDRKVNRLLQVVS